jgi:hypothetical protein
MTQGTVSIILGCHSQVHSIYVIKAWFKLYHKPPCFWELVCILVHDWGHFGKNYLDDFEAKKQHWILGARIAKVLFGQKGFDFCAGHCEYSGLPQSKLYKADKLSWYKSSRLWSYWYQIFEPKISMGYSKREAYDRFMAQVSKSIESGEYKSTHKLYLERCVENAKK